MRGEASERVSTRRRSTEWMPDRDGNDTAQKFRDPAARCRRLAFGITDWAASRKLLELALEFEERADALEAPEPGGENGLS